MRTPGSGGLGPKTRVEDVEGRSQTFVGCDHQKREVKGRQLRHWRRKGQKRRLKEDSRLTGDTGQRTVLISSRASFLSPLTLSTAHRVQQTTVQRYEPSEEISQVQTWCN